MQGGKFFRADGLAAVGAGVFHILCSQFLVTDVCSVRTLPFRVFMLRPDVLQAASAQIIHLSRKGVHWISEIPGPHRRQPCLLEKFFWCKVRLCPDQLCWL